VLKTVFQNGIFGEMGGKNLEGDCTIQTRVARAVNFAHAARAEQRTDLVWPEPGTR
jgi:hypothetical protein